MIVNPMNLFSLPSCELHKGNDKTYFVHHSIPNAWQSTFLLDGHSKNIYIYMCCVVMTDFIPNLGSATVDTEGHFNCNFTTILICKIGTKVPMLQYHRKNQRQISEMYSS